VYAGDLRIGDTPKGEFFRVHEGREQAASDVEGRAAPVRATGCHQGIVPRDLFDRVLAKIERRTKRRGNPRRRGPYALTGVLLCGNCGKPMYAATDRNGRTIYRCHRQETNPAEACGYWIAYEEGVMPYLFDRFLPDLRRQLAELAARPRQDPGTGELELLRAELARLDADLKTARERFLLAPASLAAGLQSALEGMEARRKDLAGRIDALASEGGADLPGAAAGVLRKARPGLLGMIQAVWPDLSGDRVIVPGEVERFPEGVSSLDIELVETPVFREALKRLNAEVSVWFRRKAKGRGYDLDKVRVRAEVPLCNGESANATS
jgi:hypothetical protein